MYKRDKDFQTPVFQRRSSIFNLCDYTKKKDKFRTVTAVKFDHMQTGCRQPPRVINAVKNIILDLPNSLLLALTGENNPLVTRGAKPITILTNRLVML